MKTAYAIIVFFVLVTGCQPSSAPVPRLGSDDIAKVITEVTNVMVHDVTNPPLAARFFAYISLAGYEVVALNDSLQDSMHGVLNEYPVIQPPTVKGYATSLSAVLAMLETASAIQPSGYRLAEYQQQLLDSCAQLGYSEAVLTQSLAYAKNVSQQVIAYAQADGYNKTSNYPKYTPIKEAGYWYPTPPAYFSAVEPHFNKVRPLTMDSASQFKPAPPVSFSEDKASPFFRMLYEVYEEGNSLPDDHRAIASFWDCNPFAMQNTGHLMVALKKISPGAHWMGITGIACRTAKKNFSEAMRIHTVVAIGLMDAFLSCWDEKYRSHRIRPETAIRKYIDPAWQPLLQTPPFPEYTSGHSVASGAAGAILTYYLGDNFSFTDDVEVPYGVPARTFPSFIQAAKEAAASRLYGGIHYRDANENGTQQGIGVGKWVVRTVEKTAANEESLLSLSR